MTDEADVRFELRLPPVAGELVEQGLDLARSARWAERLHDRDARLWSLDARVQGAIAGALGWLDAPDHFSGQIAALEGFGEKSAENLKASIEASKGRGLERVLAGFKLPHGEKKEGKVAVQFEAD